MAGNRNLVLGALAVVIAVVAYFSFQWIHESGERDEAIRSVVEESEAALRAGDASAALRLVAGALRDHTDSGTLQLLAARAYCGLGRFKDALEACAKAEELDLEDSDRELLRFLAARAIAGRYIEAGVVDDRKRAEADLVPLSSDPRFGAACQVLLGRMRARGAVEPGDREAAMKLLRDGLSDASAAEWLTDLDKAKQQLEALESGQSPKAGG